MPEEKYQRVQKLIDALYEELDTVVLPLSEDDKKEMQRLGAKTMEFVRNSVKHAKLTPELVREAGVLLLPGTMFQPEDSPTAGRELRVAFANVDRTGIDTLFARLAGLGWPLAPAPDSA